MVAGGRARQSFSQHLTLAQREARAQERAGLLGLSHGSHGKRVLTSQSLPSSQSSLRNRPRPLLLPLASGMVGFLSRFPPNTHLPEASSGVDGGCGWTLGSGKRIRAAAAALGRALGWRKTGLRDLTGGCSEAKPEEWPLKRGLTLSLGRNQPRLGSEPSSEMGALPLPIPGGQGHGVKGPQIQSLVRIYTLPGPHVRCDFGQAASSLGFCCHRPNTQSEARAQLGH